MKKINVKQSFASRSFKMGGFQTLVMVIVIALVVVLNLIVGKMNLSVDLSSDKIYTLTEESKELIKGLSDDIILYYMCQSGNEVEQIEKVLNEYDSLSHVTLEKKDPVVYPNFAKNYTDEELTGNDVIVVNTKTKASRFVKQAEMITQGYNSTYTATSNTLDVEGQITAAIWGVTSRESKKIYLTTGHGEVDLDSEFENMLEKSNISTDALETKSADKIPEDSDALHLYGPMYDLTDEEYTLISSYMKNGGRVLLFLNAEAEEQKNLNKLMTEYGIHRVNGYVVDTQQCYSPAYPTILQPTVKEHDITGDATDALVYQANVVGLTKEAAVRSTLTVDSLLETSVEAFSRTDMTASSIERIESDIAGPFSVGMAASETVSDDSSEEKSAKLVVYGSYTMADKSFASTTQFGNRSILLNTMNWLCDSKSKSFAIPARSLDMQQVSIEASDKIVWTSLLVVILPLAVLGIGFTIWFRRRKR